MLLRPNLVFSVNFHSAIAVTTTCCPASVSSGESNTTPQVKRVVQTLTIGSLLVIYVLFLLLVLRPRVYERLRRKLLLLLVLRPPIYVRLRLLLKIKKAKTPENRATKATFSFHFRSMKHWIASSRCCRLCCRNMKATYISKNYSWDSNGTIFLLWV
jgi:hypothetical protein